MTATSTAVRAGPSRCRWAAPRTRTGQCHRYTLYERVPSQRNGATPRRRAKYVSWTLATTAPQFLEAARRFGKAGLMPDEVIQRIVPSA